MNNQRLLKFFFSFSLVALFASFGAVSAADNRTVILLSPIEREHVLHEMRGFLESVQGIVAATAKNDMQSAANSAKKSGAAAMGGAPTSLMGKLPMSFKQMGMATHKAFDQLAMDAEAMEDKQQVISQLGELMQNCVSCHSTYRIDPDRIEPSVSVVAEPVVKEKSHADMHEHVHGK